MISTTTAMAAMAILGAGQVRSAEAAAVSCSGWCDSLQVFVSFGPRGRLTCRCDPGCVARRDCCGDFADTCISPQGRGSAQKLKPLVEVSLSDVGFDLLESDREALPAGGQLATRNAARSSSEAEAEAAAATNTAPWWSHSMDIEAAVGATREEWSIQSVL